MCVIERDIERECVSVCVKERQSVTERVRKRPHLVNGVVPVGAVRPHCPPLGPIPTHLEGIYRKVDVRLPGKGNSNSHGARPVHLIITMTK